MSLLCWKCHDPHSYRAFMRNATDIKEAVLYDNNMCLRCHADFSNFTLLTDRPEINVVDSHEWLPNQVAHFRSIRCIECHTEINDTVLIAHKILPKSQGCKKLQNVIPRIPGFCIRSISLRAWKNARPVL